jgi:hypothetical protein
MECVEGKVHFYVSKSTYVGPSKLNDESMTTFPNYIGSIDVEVEYTLDA